MCVLVPMSLRLTGTTVAAVSVHKQAGTTVAVASVHKQAGTTVAVVTVHKQALATTTSKVHAELKYPG